MRLSGVRAIRVFIDALEYHSMMVLWTAKRIRFRSDPRIYHVCEVLCSYCRVVIIMPVLKLARTST